MISRRAALGLGALGFVAPAAVAAISASAPSPVGAQSAPASGPLLDRPIVVKWRYEINAEYGDTPLIADGVAYGRAQGSFAFALDAETGVELWRQSLAAGWTSAAIGDGLALFATVPGGIVALDATTGTQEWRFETSERITFTPVIAQGVVYFAEQYGDLYALDLATGAEKWRSSVTRDEWYSVQSFTLWNDTAFTITDDPQLIALDIETGKEKWSIGAENNRFGTPVLENGVLYFTGSDGLYALDAETGNPIWQFIGESGGFHGPVLENGVVYWSVFDGPLYALDAESGEMIWQNFAGGYGAANFGIDGTTLVYELATGGQMFPFYTVHGIDKQSGQEIWRSEEFWDVTSIALPGDGTVVVNQYHTRDNTGDRILFALDVATAAEIWRLTTAGGFSGQTSFSNGNLYTAGRNGTTFCLGNLPSAILAADVTLRGAPSSTGIERGTAVAGDRIDTISTRNTGAGQEWIEVTIGDATGWIPLEAIDPATIPPEGEIEYVYIPD